VLVLLALYKLRDTPWLEFIATIVVCGIVEYFNGRYRLRITNHEILFDRQ